MPLIMLHRLASAAEVPTHAIVGTRTGTAVSHVGLLAARTSLAAACSVQVCHMGPPLERPGTMPADAVAWRDDLTNDEVRDLGDWVQSVDVTVAYTAVPSVAYPPPERDDDTGRPIATAFSCAGFVAQAYREAGVSLVVDDARLPRADRALLFAVWGERTVRAGVRYGLVGGGPWPVLLPGYLLHAANLPRALLPFAPTLADVDVSDPGAAPSPVPP